MAPQTGKVEVDVYIRASAEHFHDTLCSKTHHITNMSLEKVKSIEILEGEWGAEGSIICWNYIIDGKACVAKQVVEAIDRENNTITYNVIEGDLLEDYKSFKFILHVIPEEKGSIARWILEYEKLKDHIPDPHSLLHSVIEVSKHIDAYLNQDQKLTNMN